MSGLTGTNFGETIAYWYFRLNGFFPITNFVQHRVAITRRSSSDGSGRPLRPGRRTNSDADILAVRFPHVFEDVGGQCDDWDDARFETWNWDFRNRIVAVICQVKTGKWRKREVETAFARERLEYAINRFGIFPKCDSFQLSNELYDQPSVRRDNISISKVLMSPRGHTPSSTSEASLNVEQCCRLDLEDAHAFIQARIGKYSDEKRASRMLFADQGIQALAYFNGSPFVFPGLSVSSSGAVQQTMECG